MKVDDRRMVVVVRNGQGEHGALSEEGIAQMEALGGHIDTIIMGEYGTREAQRLLVDFSVLHVALASVAKLRKNGESYFVMEPPSFKKTRKVLTKGCVLEEQKLLSDFFHKMIALSSHLDASVIVIVAQSPVAIVLAEIAYKKFTRHYKDFGAGLEPGAGLCIIPRRMDASCDVVRISSGGIIPLLF